jgi:hypothetical protein
MHILVNRTNQFDNFTIGDLSVDGVRRCYSMEPPVREVMGQPVESWKVQDHTAIPVGTYDVTITYSPHFGRDMPLINGVPGFSAVRIHPGNSDASTEGCTLVGSTWDGSSDWIGASIAVFEPLRDEIIAALAAGDTVSYTVQ